jgi:hypothetical protein
MTTVDQPRPFGVAPQRTPVQFDPTTGGLRIGPHERRIEDPTVPSQVYSAYLSLLHAVRGTKPGTKLPLRSADLEALLLIVGDDPRRSRRTSSASWASPPRRPASSAACSCGTAAAWRPRRRRHPHRRRRHHPRR